MKMTIKSALGSICGALAIASMFAAVCVTDGSAHEMAIRVGGAIGFTIFSVLWSVLKGGER